MAELLQSMLSELQLEDTLLIITADNASNNETLASKLYFKLAEKSTSDSFYTSCSGRLRFLGIDSYIRCLAYVLDLILNLLLDPPGRLALAVDSTNGNVTIDNLHVPSAPEVLTPPDIKASIIARLTSTDPIKVIALYSAAIHPWFGIFSESMLSSQHPASWDAASVDFVLLCFGIVLLTSAPEEVQGGYNLQAEHRSMYLLSKSWISLLEGAGLNSVKFVKARLLINLFEVAHGFAVEAYFSIANVVRAADALSVFQQQPMPQSMAETDMEEYMLMWCGIAILDRFIAIENGQWPPVTRGRQIPPNVQNCNRFAVLKHPSAALPRAFEASLLLDNMHTYLHQPTPHMAFNFEEVTAIVRTVTSFETFMKQSLPENEELFSTSLALSSTALLLAYENGTKPIGPDKTFTCASAATTLLNAKVDDISDMVSVLDRYDLATKALPLPPFVTFVVYRAAAITTGRLHSGSEAEANLQRLRILRRALRSIAPRWLAGERYMKLLDEDTSPRILKALSNNPSTVSLQ
ncbi:hypothetical protein PENFLA_c014G04612 [Penicillium flavigenum]|uniref:Transcription factor domain-containing protein n=1 Tax=Penicillium flavigenum TaxID=254877 RepID=A0A1V6T598_9EURO|nr:hypothetical protein PENFLA_c014G04612 [Penicillium flavigenum]